MGKIRQKQTGEVHKLKDSETSACGFNITKNPSEWEKVSDGTRITCDKNGCKNR